LRTLATPEPIKDWSLTSLKEKLIKIGAKMVSHGRYVIFQMAELVLEFWPCEMSKNDSYKLLKDALNRGGYKCFYNLERPIEIPYSNEALDDLYKLYLSSSHTGPGYTDLLLV
jgi:hypothetical protein